MTTMFDGARGRLPDADGELEYARLAWLTDQRIGDVERLPQTVRILLENLLRRAGTRDVADEDVAALAAWPGPAKDIAFMPARVLMQDFTASPLWSTLPRCAAPSSARGVTRRASTRSCRST